MEQDEETSTANLCRLHQLRFVSAAAADLVALRRPVAPVYAMLERDPETRAQIAQIEQLGHGSAPQALLSCAGVTTARAAPGPLDGVYQFSVSYADLTAAGADPSEVLPENASEMTFVFDRGHFAFTQDYLQGHACTWGYGTLTIRGDTLTQLFTDGGGIAPTGATNKPGEDSTFRWSLYRDALTLHRLPGSPSPTADIVKPWKRVSTTPSWRYFTQGCLPPAKALPS